MRNAQPIVPETSGDGSTVTPASPQTPATSSRRNEEDCSPIVEQRSEREAGQVHQAVSRWHERREVLEPVRVQPPDDGAHDLAGRGDDDHRQRLETHDPRLEREQAGEEQGSEHAERELPRVTDLTVDGEAAHGPRTDDDESDERKAAHHRIFVDRPVTVWRYLVRVIRRRERKD